MTWQVSSTTALIPDGAPTLHEDSDEAVDAFMGRVRSFLDKTKAQGPEVWRQISLQWEADLWYADTTTDMLKRYLTSAEGVDGENDPNSTLHVSIGTLDARVDRVHTLSEVIAEFAPEGTL